MIFNIASSAAIHTKVQDWAVRVVRNGGSLPSGNTQLALSNFMTGMDETGLTTKMKSVMCYAPDNLIASITPLIKTFGVDPWTNHNFIVGDLTINGLAGNASNKYLQTGFNTNMYNNSGNCGLTLYNTTLGSGTNQIDFGCSVVTNHMFMAIFYPTLGLIFDCLTNTSPRLQLLDSQSTWTGFLCGNRTSATICRVDAANSTTPYFTKVSQTNATGAGTNDEMYAFTINPTQAYSSKRFSFMALHDGLSFSDGNNFFNLVQNMRKQIGGGFT
jgi:hypothetical protein